MKEKHIREIGNKICEEDILGTSKTFLFCTSEFLQSAMKWLKYKWSPNLGVRGKAYRTHKVSLTKQENQKSSWRKEQYYRIVKTAR